MKILVITAGGRDISASTAETLLTNSGPGGPTLPLPMPEDGHRINACAIEVSGDHII